MVELGTRKRWRKIVSDAKAVVLRTQWPTKVDEVRTYTTSGVLKTVVAKAIAKYGMLCIEPLAITGTDLLNCDA